MKQFSRRRSNAESYFDCRRASIYRYKHRSPPSRRRYSVTLYNHRRRQYSVNPYDRRRRSSIQRFDRSVHLLQYRARSSVHRYHRRKSTARYYYYRRRSWYTNDIGLRSTAEVCKRRRSGVAPLSAKEQERRSPNITFCYLPRTMDTTSNPDLEPVSPISSYYSPFTNPRISANEQ